MKIIIPILLFMFTLSVYSIDSKSKSFFADAILSSIGVGQHFVSAAESEKYYLFIDSTPRLTRINKSSGAKKSVSLPAPGSFDYYLDAQVSDDQKLLFTYAGPYTIYVDIENMKVVSKLSKDTSSLPDGCSKNVYKNWSIRTNNYDDIMVQNILDDHKAKFIESGSLLTDVRKLLPSAYVKGRGEIFEARLFPNVKEIWSTVDNFLVIIDADTHKAKFAIELATMDRHRRRSDYDEKSGHFAIESRNGVITIIDIKTKTKIKDLRTIGNSANITNLQYLGNQQGLAVLDDMGRLLVYNTQNYGPLFDSAKLGIVSALHGGNNKTYSFLLFSQRSETSDRYFIYNFKTNKMTTMSSQQINGNNIYLLNDLKMVGHHPYTEKKYYSFEL